MFCIGSVIVEAVTEHRHFKEASPAFLSALMNCEAGEIPQVVADSGLLNRQKVALLTVYDYRSLPGDALMALARKLVAREERRYGRIAGRNEMGVKAAPMLGLMGTLIPLGPGIAALGTGDLVSLSQSIVLAFDTTVAGLATAVVCLAVVKIRRNWYEEYMGEFDGSMATMLQRIREMRADGQIATTAPTDYASVYADALKRTSRKDAAAAEEVAADARAAAAKSADALKATGPEAAESPDAAKGAHAAVVEAQPAKAAAEG